MMQYFSVSPILSLQMKSNPVATIFMLLFATTCTYFCWWYWKLNRAYAKFPSLRVDVRGLWKIMSGRYPKNVPFTCVLFNYINEWALQFGKDGFLVLWLFRPYLLLFNEGAMKRLYADPAVVNKSSIYNLFIDVFGNGLITSEGNIWKKHRKLLDPVFYVGALKRKLNIFNDTGAQLVTELQKQVGQPTSDILGILKECTLKALSQTILGLRLDDEIYNEKLVKYFNEVHVVSWSFVYRLPRPWLYWNIALPFFSHGRKYQRARNYIREFTLEVLSELKTSIMASAESGEDLEYDVESKKSFIRILLEQHLKDPTLTMEDVVDHITTIILAGHDTISYTLLWCLYMLGLHPEVQEKAFKEIDALTRINVTYEDLCQLKYLECFIKETLRLYPTVPAYARKLNKDIHLEDYTIPNGTEIVFSIYLLHKRPNLFPDPEKFDPERFSGNSEVSPWAFIPFAEGYRSCIGKKFAMMEIKVILFHVIRRFKFETLEKIEASHLDWILTLAPAKPIPLHITLR